MKRTITAMLALCLAAGMALPASALEYTIESPDGPDYGKPTSVEVVHTADGGARKNEDVSKNAALVPPGFGTPSMDTRNTGSYLTPNLAPGGAPATGAVVNGSGSSVITPGSPIGSVTGSDTTIPSTRYTEVTDDLYYKGGYLATLKIPAIGLTVKVYEGTDSKTLARAQATSRTPRFGAEISRWRRTTGASTTTSGGSIRWRLGIRSLSPPSWGPGPTR